MAATRDAVVRRYGVARALEDCERADVVVAPFNIHDCAVQTVIDEPALWHHGAHAIYFDGDKIRIVFTHERRGERPWSVGWKTAVDD